MKINDLIELVSSKKTKETLVIPEYQRDYVWDGDGSVSLLLDSIYSKYPIGSIMFWVKETKDINGDVIKVENVLIDGLQRTFSIFSIKQIPLKFLSLELFKKFCKRNEIPINSNDEKKLNLLFLTLNKNILNDNQYTKFEERIQKFPDKPKENKFHYLKTEEISSFFDDEIENNSLQAYKEAILSLVNWIESDDGFGSEEINIIKIKDIVEEEIPLIFERINSNGKKLSKYEIYSSSWNDYRIKLDLEADYIEKFLLNRKIRYKKSLNIDKIEINEKLERATYNPSNVMHAIFERAMHKNNFMKSIFMKGDTISDINTMSYIMATYLDIKSAKDFKSIGMKLRDKINNSKREMDIIIGHIRCAFKIVSKSLAMFEFLSNDGENESVNFKKIKVSEHLIVAFINTILVEEAKYRNEILKLGKGKEKAKREIGKEKTMKISQISSKFKYWFIIESLDTKFGSGTGSRAWKFVHVEERYSTFKLSDIFNSLNNKVEEFIDKESKLSKRSNYSRGSVLLMGLMQFNKNDSGIMSDHVDHVFPKSVLAKCELSSKDIHCLWNLQLLDAGTNSTKNDKISSENSQWDWILNTDDNKLKLVGRNRNKYNNNLKKLNDKFIDEIYYVKDDYEFVRKNYLEILEIRKKHYIKIIRNILKEIKQRDFSE